MHMDKGKAMTGLDRHIKASFALLLITSLSSGCATGPAPWEHPVETIPAQVCSGNGDTDMDGITDCNDMCPDTPRNRSVDSSGCPLPEEMPP
jgi:OOP family OmpA-OmpF porin